MRAEVRGAPPRMMMDDPEPADAGGAREVGDRAGLGVAGGRRIGLGRLLRRQPDLVQQELHPAHEIGRRRVDHACR